MLQLILLIQRGTQSTQTPLKERQVATALQADAGRTVSAQFQVGTEVDLDVDLAKAGLDSDLVVCAAPCRRGVVGRSDWDSAAVACRKAEWWSSGSRAPVVSGPTQEGVRLPE